MVKKPVKANYPLQCWIAYRDRVSIILSFYLFTSVALIAVFLWGALAFWQAASQPSGFLNWLENATLIGLFALIVVSTILGCFAAVALLRYGGIKNILLGLPGFALLSIASYFCVAMVYQIFQ